MSGQLSAFTTVSTTFLSALTFTPCHSPARRLYCSVKAILWGLTSEIVRNPCFTDGKCSNSIVTQYSCSSSPHDDQSFSAGEVSYAGREFLASYSLFQTAYCFVKEQIELRYLTTSNTVSIGSNSPFQRYIRRRRKALKSRLKLISVSGNYSFFALREMDNASQAPCNNDGKAVFNSKSTRHGTGNEVYAVFDHGNGSDPASTTFQDSSPQSSRSDSVWSITAQIDENETFASTIDFPDSPNIDLLLIGAQFRQLILPIPEETTLFPESLNQQCHCCCHAATWEETMSYAQQESRMLPMEHYISQACNEGAALAYFERGNAAPCEFCECHVLYVDERA